jgi:Ribbon-helix-helix protein, copG family
MTARVGKRPGPGRKPAVPGGRPGQIVVRLSADEARALAALCKANGYSPSEMVRRALAEWARR